MSNLNGRKVSLARLHETLHIQGFGELGKVLTSVTNKGKLDMTYEAPVLYVKATSAQSSSVTAEFAVPLANCVSIEFIKE